MTDILIRGMEMPKEGETKTIRIYPDGTCSVPYWTEDCKDLDCTAIPLPEGHGKCIDADALKPNLYVFDDITKEYYINYKEIKNAPTIVPAEGGGGE